MGIFSSKGSIEPGDQAKAFENLPDIDKEMIRKILRDWNKYSEDAMAELICDMAGLKAEFPDGKVRFSYPGFGYSSFAINQPGLIIKSMPVLLFAIYRGEYKVAVQLFNSEEYGAPDKMGPVVTYGIDFCSDHDPFSNTDQAGAESIRLVGKQENKCLYGFVLADLCRSGKHISQQFAYRFLKKYYGEAESGWFRCNHGIVPHEAPGTVNPLTGNAFCAEPVKTNALTIYVKLLDFIRKTDEAFFRKFVDAGVFAELFVKSSFIADDENRRENLRLIRKMYVPGIADAEKVWHETGMFAEGDLNERRIIGMTIAAYPQLSKNWAYVTGEKLTFRIGHADLDDLKYEEVDHIPFGCYASMKADGTIAGNFLKIMIRGADQVDYEGDSGKYRFDLDYLLDEGGEELALMALKKDFIRARDVETALKHLEEKKKSFLIPALLLKAHGEWA